MSCAYMYFAWSNLSVFAAVRSVPLEGTLVNCLEDED